MKYLLLLFIAMSSFQAFGQYSLNGQVTDSTTSAPLDYIEIILKSPDNEWSNLSDEQGKYIFENLAPGMYPHAWLSVMQLSHGMLSCLAGMPCSGVW